jgi:uncharacterized protein
MLVVDLNRLGREGRALLEAEVPPDDAFWAGTDTSPRGPLRVQIEAQQVGADVVVRGRLRGEFNLDCRRCLVPVVAGIDEELGLLFRAGTSPGDDEPADVLPLPRGGALDLAAPIREQVLLAVPRYVYCRPECPGLCPQCGQNLNEGPCDCARQDEDDRWAPLRRLKADE